MGAKEKKWFDVGRSNMLRELKRKGKLEDVKLLKDNKFRKLSGEIFELRENLKAVEEAVKYWKNRANRFENKGIVVAEEINKLKIPKKEKKRIIDIFYSGLKSFSKKSGGNSK